LLSYRGHSKAELKRKITEKAGAKSAEKAVEKLTGLGLLDDVNFAKEYARELIERKYYSRTRATYQMSEKGIDRQIIDTVLDEMDIDPIAQIGEIINKKFTPMPTLEKEKKRMMSFLMGRGYSYSDIRSAISEFGEFLETFEE